MCSMFAYFLVPNTYFIHAKLYKKRGTAKDFFAFFTIRESLLYTHARKCYFGISVSNIGDGCQFGSYILRKVHSSTAQRIMHEIIMPHSMALQKQWGVPVFLSVNNAPLQNQWGIPIFLSVELCYYIFLNPPH